MAKAKTLAIFSAVLGNAPFARQLQRALDQIQEIEPVYLKIASEDYQAYPAPKWARLSDPWEARYVARQKAKTLAAQNFDLLLVLSWEFAVEFRHWARRMPAAACMDALPSTIDAQLRRRGEDSWKRRIASGLHNRAFHAAVPEFRHFLACGSDAAAALKRDYGVDPNKIDITLQPQDLDSWKPGARTSTERLRLLFVGNDFRRKGGDFLLQLFTHHLAGFCELVIASNDSFQQQCDLPAGVEWLRGRGQRQLIEVFQRSDLFVFPTRQDFAATNAICEALACGVPCIASDVGGIGDVVINDATGFLMPFDATPHSWAKIIRDLHEDRAKLARLASGARRIAEENLNPDRLRDSIRTLVQRLLADTNSAIV